MSAVLSACPYCGVGCGLRLEGDRERLSVAGDPDHPANAGRLCSKGAALGETVGLEGRLLYPMIGQRRVGWDEAVRTVADRFSETIARHGPDAVAFYVSGQLLTEDYYAANKLMKGFIGSGNIDTNSRLCMASAVVAHKLAFGEDVVPGCYEDLDLAELVVFSGHNAAWTHPVLYRRMEAQLARGQRHIVIDPRETDTSRGAFLHLKIRSQSDVRLWNGLLAHLHRSGAIDRDFIRRHTSGWAETEAALAADDQSPVAVAADCGIGVSDFLAFCRAFAETDRTVTLFSMGANQSAQGVAKGLAIINAHLATGRVSRPGASPFSITGQPNAMGGRETGGLSTTLASHLEFDAVGIDIVSRFWGTDCIARAPGLKAVEMFEAVRDGRIKALWVMATNPAVSMPDVGAVREALASCPFVVVSDVMADTDTSRFAHVKLPALAWGEKEGTVTNSERCITRQRTAMPSPGEARADWRAVADVGAAMGFAEAFAWDSPADVFREYAALTNLDNTGERVLRLGPLARLDASAYDNLEPIQWPVGDDGAGLPRPFASGRFPTPDGRAAFQPLTAGGPAEAVCPEFPLVLNTGRLRDQWHTMTRTGLSPRLMKHAPEPVLDIHPIDAGRFNIDDGGLVKIATACGEAVLEARVTDAVRPGEMFAPMHWSADFAPQARANMLVSSTHDPRSGQPEFKHTPARIAPAPVAWRAFLISRERIALPDALWHRRVVVEGGHLWEIAASADAPSVPDIARSIFETVEGAEIIEASDTRGRFLRRAALDDGRLAIAFLATVTGGLPHRDWLVAQLRGHRLDDWSRAALLAGGAAPARRSRCVCACFDISQDAILAAASAGSQTKAGTNCGSCRLEVARILQTAKEGEHAAA